MLEVACADVPRDDPAVQYYFGKYLLSQEPERATCIARNLTYNVMEVSTGTIAGDCEQLPPLQAETALQSGTVYGH